MLVQDACREVSEAPENTDRAAINAGCKAKLLNSEAGDTNG
jgi:hypothetical protein